MSTLLDDDDVARRLRDLADWKRDGDAIVADFTFDDFGAAMVFVNRVAEMAEENDHHPDIDIRWNRLHLALSSHDAGGLTRKDFDLAARISVGE